MMSDSEYAESTSRAQRAEEYLAMLELDTPGSTAVVDRAEFLREYGGSVSTLDEAFARCRARKNQREAKLRKKLRHTDS